MTHLFAYGTLMFETVWRAVVGRKFRTQRARLHGFAALQLRGRVYPGLVPAASTSSVQGVVYLDLDPEAVRRLDSFEGHQYRRIQVEVQTGGGVMPCQTYRFKDDYTHLLSDTPWNPDAFL